MFRLGFPSPRLSQKPNTMLVGISEVVLTHYANCELGNCRLDLVALVRDPNAEVRDPMRKAQDILLALLSLLARNTGGCLRN